MLRWFPRFQVATTGFLNVVVTKFMFGVHVKKKPLPSGNNPIAVNKYYYYYYSYYYYYYYYHAEKCGTARQATFDVMLRRRDAAFVQKTEVRTQIKGKVKVKFIL